MTRQNISNPRDTHEEHPSDWYGGADRNRQQRGGAPDGARRQDEERDEWSRRPNGGRSPRDDHDEGRREPSHGGNRYDESSSWRGGERGWREDQGREWSRSQRGQQDLDEREGGWSGDGDWRGRENGGRQWDRSGQTASRERRDEENDPRPYYAGTSRRRFQPFSYSGGTGMFVAESFSMTGPYAGKGPKGYKRSGERLKEEVCDRLERQGDIDASELEVECKDGIVTLKGKVRDRRTKRQAEEIIEDVYGVEDVMNELRIDRSAFEKDSSSSSRSGASAQGGERAGQQARG
jgi:hypothetical protein